MTTQAVPQSAPDKKAKGKIIRTWLLLVGGVLFWIVFWAIREKTNPAPRSEPPVSLTGDSADLFAHVFVMCFLAALFLAGGIGGYFVVVLTNCFTFNFNRPIWSSLKAKIWLANLYVLLAVGLGVGFLASAFLTPVLTQMGVSPDLSGFLPIAVSVGGIQLIFIWVLMWAPLEIRIIAKRLAALGITPEQLQTGIYLGLSDPDQRSIKKRFGAIEEDIGMLWIAPDRLIYYGDSRQMNIARDQLLSVERLVDGRSVTALSGTAHVILNYIERDGTQQRVRLHTEGVKTMGGKRSAMEVLNGKIEAWRAAGAPVATPL
jgi:hypothetical protein